MAENSFATSFTVDRTPAEVFTAINDVRGWWAGEIQGSTDRLDNDFTYRYEDIHRSTQRIVELIPGQKIVWLVTDAHLNFTADPTEWVGTRITFELIDKGAGTEVRFTHAGLVPGVECFEMCSSAWTSLIGGNLRNLLAEDALPTPR